MGDVSLGNSLVYAHEPAIGVFQRKVEKVFAPLSLIIACLIMVFLTVHILIPKSLWIYLSFGLAALVIACASPRDSFAFMLFLTPLTGLFRNEAAQTSYVTYLFLIFYLVFFVKGLGKPVSSHGLGLLFIYLLFLVDMLIVHVVYKDNDILHFTLSYLFYLGLPVVIFIYGPWKPGLSKSLLYLALGFLLSSAVCIALTYLGEKYLLLLNAISEGVVNQIAFGSTQIYRCSGAFSDANFFAFFGLLTAVLLYSCAESLKREKVFAYLGSILCIAASLTSLSKMCVIVTSLFVLTVVIKGFFMGKKGIVASLIAIAVIALALGVFGSKAEQAFIGRLNLASGDLIGAITTDRSNILLEYIKVLSEGPRKLWFGVGIANFSQIELQYNTHNAPLGMLIHFGILGSMILLWYWIYAFRHFVFLPVAKKRVHLLFSFAFVFFFCSLALNIETTPQTAIYLLAWFLLANEAADPETGKADRIVNCAYDARYPNGI